jgi:hypothetical protein
MIYINIYFHWHCIDSWDYLVIDYIIAWLDSHFHHWYDYYAIIDIIVDAIDWCHYDIDSW